MILFNKMRESAKIPNKRISDAGYDLYSAFDSKIKIPARSTTKIHTGIRAVIPDGYYAQIETRSSIAQKGVFVVGGIIDNGYRGEWIVVLMNSTDEDVYLDSDNAVAQVMLHNQSHFHVRVISDKEFEKYLNTDRGVCGFGSTDRKQ